MRIRIIALGTKMPSWVAAGYDDYARRLPRDWTVELVALPLATRGKSTSTDAIIEKEADAMLGAIGKGDKVVALEVKGRPWSTEELARQLGDWRMSGVNYSLLIGGPDGLSQRCRDRADLQWSLSPLTLPHPLVRIVVIEQLYRAYSLLHNHPYHK